MRWDLTDRTTENDVDRPRSFHPPIWTLNRKHKALHHSTPSPREPLNAAARRSSCPSPATPSLAAYRRSSISSTSAHSLAAAASPGHQSRISANPSNGPAGRRRGRRGPVSRGLARLRLGLSVDLPAVVAASRPLQAPLLAIPGRRPPARSPPRASSGTPPASSRGRPTAGSPWTRTWAPHLKAWWGASTTSGGALPSSPSAHTAARQCLVDIKVYFLPLLALESIPCLLPNSIQKQISQSSRFVTTVQCSSSSRHEWGIQHATVSLLLLFPIFLAFFSTS
jgi:hypothetical protein